MSDGVAWIDRTVGQRAASLSTLALLAKLEDLVHLAHLGPADQDRFSVTSSDFHRARRAVVIGDRRRAIELVGLLLESVGRSLYETRVFEDALEPAILPKWSDACREIA